jgi:hypothetical protein
VIELEGGTRRQHRVCKPLIRAEPEQFGPPEGVLDPEVRARSQEDVLHPARQPDR